MKALRVSGFSGVLLLVGIITGCSLPSIDSIDNLDTQGSTVLTVHSAAPDKSKAIDGEKLKVGDVVTIGTKTGDLCDYPEFGIAIKGKPGKAVSIDLRSNPACHLIVHKKSEEPSSGESEESAQALSRTARNWTWMYGWGGTWDKLTQVFQLMTFEYYILSGGNRYARITSRSGSCWTSFTGWSIDACYSGSYTPGLALYVSSYWMGNFHWLINYYHTLYNNITGDPYGNITCYGFFSGSIVSGVLYQCVY